MRTEMQEFALAKQKPNVDNRLGIYFIGLDGSRNTDVTKVANNGVVISKVDNSRLGKIQEYRDRKPEYFLKIVQFGRAGELLINPFETEVVAAYSDTDSGARQFVYSRVTKGVFDAYIQFLSTRNTAYFTNAERMIKNGDI